MTNSNSVYFANLGSNSFAAQDGATEAVCIANISPRERQLRLRFGITQFVITLLILGVLIAFDVNPLWRLPLLFMFWGAAIGCFQARDKT